MTTDIKIDLIDEVEKRLDELSKLPDFKTETVRLVSASCFKLLKDKSIDNVLRLCEQLLEKRKWALGVVAYDWAFRVKNQYKEETFYIFERWLVNYVRGWGDCDDFCTHAFGELIRQNNNLIDKILPWTEHPEFWVRRAAAVILIYPIKKGKLQEKYPFIIAEKLMQDEHYLVLKGYGWMLKVLSIYKSDEVYSYLMSNSNKMPRVSYRYAMEKLDKTMKMKLMEN